ncbi:Uncharacterized protein PBTT_00683 [Plasmodiophora brassicae]|nr:hypothetical protein PBRA_002178 [Plasmodiophora brassicae]
MLAAVADDGASPIGDIERYLDERSLMETRRQDELAKAWNEAVYLHIQRQIDERVADDGRVRASRDRRNRLLDGYLRALQSPGGVFLDIIHDDEYDPFQGADADPGYSVRGMKDPLKRDLRKMAFEAKLMAMGRQAQPASHQMRPCRRLDVRQWGQGRIEATPHGYFAKFVDGNGGARVPSKINESNLVLDHYNISHDPVDLARDFPAGGKHIDPQRSKAATLPLA